VASVAQVVVTLRFQLSVALIMCSVAAAGSARPAEAFETIDHENGTNSVSVQLEVQMLSGRIVVPHGDFLASAPLASVKEAVHAACGIPARHQKLIWQSTILEDYVRIGDLSLPTEDATLQLMVVLPPEDQVTQAMELMQQAAAALDVLHVRDLSDLKNLANPPGGVDRVLEAVSHLRAGIDLAIAVDSRGRVKDVSWKASRIMMKDPKRFLADLKDFKTLVENGSVPAGNIQAACRTCDAMGAEFGYEYMAKKSGAVAGLAVWVLKIIQYYQVCKAIRADFEGFDIMAEMREQLAM